MKKLLIGTTMSVAMMMCAHANAATKQPIGGGPHIAATSTSSMDGVNAGFPSFIFALLHLQ